MWSIGVGRWLSCNLVCCCEGRLVGYEDRSLLSFLVRWVFWVHDSMGGGGGVNIS